jgi:hypothetical protein
MANQLVDDELARMQIQDLYSLEDMMACPETRKMMLAESRDKAHDVLLPKLERLATIIYRHVKESELNVLEHASEGQFVGGITGLVLGSLQPQWDAAAVYENPTESLSCLRAHVCRQQQRPR